MGTAEDSLGRSEGVEDHVREGLRLLEFRLALLVTVCCMRHAWFHVFILLGYGIGNGLLCGFAWTVALAHVELDCIVSR